MADYQALLSQIKFTADGLVVVVTQCADSGQVLMVAWMNEEAVRRTLESGEVHYWSRSRRQLWHKGETSGHTQKLVSLQLDCDGDSLLVTAHQKGAACHTGARSCFFRAYDAEKDLLEESE